MKLVERHMTSPHAWFYLMHYTYVLYYYHFEIK
jgi:hypothetical protein